MEEAAPAPDPLDISTDESLVKDAQKELSTLDILVCGGCHGVFHHLEEFQEHKTEEKCSKVTPLKCENEEKPQIWGFTLWKTRQIQGYKKNGEPLPSAWDIYQKWTKLEQNEKDLWITAGRTLQTVTKISKTKFAEAAKLTPKVEKEEKDPLALDDVAESEVSNNSVLKSDVLKNITSILRSKKALRTTNDNEKEEYNVEKIIGKRFNPRKRYWEYEVKWENYAETSWEPLLHLENCKELVQEFEDKLKAEREAKELAKPPGRGRGRPRLNPLGSSPVKIVQKKPIVTPVTHIVTSPGGRPQRTSKQKALNQVKAWCGNISDDEGPGLKRHRDDEGSDDSLEKKMKLEGESDSEEDEPKTPARKIAKVIHTYNNGTGKKVPNNVLIPDAKGVVRISQKQLPSLSSGVYIMSKSSGIIKLDPTASKIATSGGQAIVKVSPKIGSTQIKIIKKDDGSKRVVQVKEGVQPKLTPITPKPRILQPVVNRTIIKKEVKKIETAPKVVQKKKEDKLDEDSDDGLPPLEFPTDLPVPTPDSPPGEFTLDPSTGKIAGVEYPSPEPEKKEESKADSIDNIVKLAAADITEDDLKTEAEPANEQTEIPVSVTESTTSTTSAKTVAENAKTSILSTAIANSNILQKTLQSPVPRPKTQPRIINQSVARPRPLMTTIVRTSAQARTPLRPQKQIPPKPKFNIATPIRHTQTSPNKNLSVKTNNVARKIGNTTIYRTKSSPAPQPKKSPQKTIKPVISMPSLDDDAQVVAAPKVTQVPAAPAVDTTDLSTFTLTTTDKPMFITGDDGTVYQVAGQNEEGQTILVTQDSEGQQQCLLVTNEALQEDTEEQVTANPAGVLMEVQDQPTDNQEEQPLVAQFIRTEPPSPGGTHKVVVMLPDGNVMVTQVTPEEYATLELDK